jgi:pimeloyl-ACP methyl ester carboxylesterase
VCGPHPEGLLMQLGSATTTDGVSTRSFTLDQIPGVLWTPVPEADRRPLVLLAHGGGQSKLAPGVVARARHYVTRCGFAAVAIDAPGHGDRPRRQRDEEFVAGLRQRMADGEPVDAHVAAYNAEIAALAVPEWRATLDALAGADGIGAVGPVGFWGISLGSAVGVPLVAAEPRIAAAVLGLVRYEDVAAAAPRVDVPVQLLVQGEDELVPRASALALYDALGSAVKTVHLNPGRHVEVPRFEVEDSAQFFARHLGSGG